MTRISGSHVSIPSYMPAGRGIGMMNGTVCPSKASFMKRRMWLSKKRNAQNAGCNQFNGLVTRKSSQSTYSRSFSLKGHAVVGRAALIALTAAASPTGTQGSDAAAPADAAFAPLAP
eukprot:CAMPEP_0176006228 /NCGR_PEP_ID=MMETSP0120_2-20121206/2612_1 /TAXON_ID=160619 /ORGANISM="Kryptoperidinium foliaceum, Strain CCMP 1326" /LENGTH=116 /DNA_ID=CAMNT_0017338957 /DNA_START=165 /DNA_END=512 /DNA_ORIENTATION=-